jgi:hypothetical protein
MTYADIPWPCQFAVLRSPSLFIIVVTIIIMIYANQSHKKKTHQHPISL